MTECQRPLSLSLPLPPGRRQSKVNRKKKKKKGKPEHTFGCLVCHLGARFVSSDVPLIRARATGRQGAAKDRLTKPHVCQAGCPLRKRSFLFFPGAMKRRSSALLWPLRDGLVRALVAALFARKGRRHAYSRAAQWDHSITEGNCGKCARPTSLPAQLYARLMVCAETTRVPASRAGYEEREDGRRVLWHRPRNLASMGAGWLV